MELIELFISFLKVGFTSFGGLSMVPLINSEMLGHGWMTAREVADIVAIAEMTPGPLGLNCATFAGMRVCGIPGAIAGNLGILFPSFSVTWLAAVFFEKFKSSPMMQRMLYGIRPVCIGLIAYAMLSIGGDSYLTDSGSVFWQGIVIGAVALYLLLKRKAGIPLTILAAAVLGIVMC